MNRYVLSSVILLLLVLSACEKDLNQEYDAPDDQAVLFEYHYINHAWGYADHGWLIDAEGKMRSFEFPENFRLPDSTGNNPMTLPRPESWWPG